MKFIKDYTSFALFDEEYLNITKIVSKGATIEELLDNAELTIEDWNGDAGPYRTINDLTPSDIKRIKSDMLDDLINYQAEYFSRSH